MPRLILGFVFLTLLGTAFAVPAAAQVVAGGSDVVVSTVQAVPGPAAGPNGPPRDNQIATGRSTLRGRLTDAATGNPLRRATVRLTAPELRGMRQITTDNDGRFDIQDLPAGRYIISGTKPGYVDMIFGQKAPLEPTTPVTLADRQTLDRIEIAMPRGGVITGRVLDEFGEPVIDAQVTPLRMQAGPGGRRPIPAGRSGTTNDIGEFRIFGLSPGRYYLSASVPNRTLINVNGQPPASDRFGYAPTFYPAATSFEGAQPITVGAGETLSEMTLTVTPTTTARVSGSVMNAQGQLLQQGAVNVMPLAAGGAGMMSGAPIFNGRFTLNGLPPGQYILRSTLGAPVPGQPMQFALATISVNGSDLEGVMLAPISPVTLHGRFLVDGTAAAALRPQAWRVTYLPGNPVAQMLMPPLPPGVTHNDLTFELTAPAGDIILRVVGLSPGWMAKEIQLNGRDVTDGFTVRTEEEGTLEVVLSDRAPTLSGTVPNDRSELVSDYSVVVFSQDSRRWESAGPGSVAMARPDKDGRFTVRTLLPGDYFVAAVSHIQQGEWTDPEYLERIRPSATAIRLSEGDSQALTLRLLDLPH